MAQQPVDRRTFAKKLAAGAAVPLAAAAGVARADDEAEQQPVEQSQPKPAPPRSLKPAEHVLELIKQRYPMGLNRQQLAQIEGQIAGHLARSRRLSAFPLTNADEPAFVFAAYRSDGP